MMVRIDPALSLRDVSKTYCVRRGEPVHAVREMTLEVMPGELVALVGESGSGKSTLARLALSLERPDSGEVWLNGLRVDKLSGRSLRQVRRTMQPVFQDSTGAFNPRKTIFHSLAQGLAGTPRPERIARVSAALEAARLTPVEAYIGRYPNQLSGGQRQRLGIARALVMEPSVILLDEPLSGADVSIQAQMLNVIEHLQAIRGVAVLLITHDISVASVVSRRMYVASDGRIFESGCTADVVSRPREEYTKQLLDAVPRLAP